MTIDRIEKFASELRQAAFPGAQSWQFAGESVREAWLRAAECADSHIEREVQQSVLRKATAKAHEVGQHAAAKAIREMRFSRD